MKKKKINATYIRADAVQVMQTNTPPRCFYCGLPYVKDLKFCKEDFSVWMPICNCLNKPTVRIATGGEVVFDDI